MLSGFGNIMSSEALQGALPRQQNNPQHVPYGLYAEQLSGSAFTVDRRHNQRTWLYKILPSVVHGSFQLYDQPLWLAPPFQDAFPPQQMRWSPLKLPEKKIDLIDSLITVAAHGDPQMHAGAAFHLYAATTDMITRYFYNVDAEMVFLPVDGRIKLFTECGVMLIRPGEIATLPRGMKCQITLPDQHALGYVCENFGAPFTLPNLGLMGPNVLAEPRHFFSPNAAYEEKSGELTLLCRSQGQLWSAPIKHSPLDIVAWHGNYLPYQYDLRLFTAVFSVSFDHTDPSIFTVMTSPSTVPGTANLDFVIFPSRWMVMDHTMRLPYYHRNIMSELMGLIYGQYDAKKDGFIPGGVSIHNSMVAHGPDHATYQNAITKKLEPEYYENTLAFMFESHYRWHPSPWALASSLMQDNYGACWQGLTKTFKP